MISSLMQGLVTPLENLSIAYTLTVEFVAERFHAFVGLYASQTPTSQLGELEINISSGAELVVKVSETDVEFVYCAPEFMDSERLDATISILELFSRLFGLPLSGSSNIAGLLFISLIEAPDKTKEFLF